MRAFSLILFAVFAACGEDDTPAARDTAETTVADTTVADTADADEAPEVDAPPTDLCAEAPLASLRLTVDGTALRDAHGRDVRLRGLNTGGRAKIPPFVPFAFADESPGAPPFADAAATYFGRVKDWGLNVVRLPFTWEAIEPTRGTYDEVFLARLDGMVAAAGAHGLRVVLDLHQDVFARPYCGDGFPLWAMSDPDPAPADCANWFNQYFLPPVQREFDRFWGNEDGLMDAFEALWRMLATRYAEVDAVVGLEIINEPGWGSMDMDDFSRDVLTPFYSRLAAIVNEVAPGRLVLVDPTGVDGVLLETAMTLPAGEGIVFAPHYYNGQVAYLGQVPEAVDVMSALAKWKAVGEDWDVPVFVGEFGVAHHVEGAARFMRLHWEALEALGLHGTQWEYSVTGQSWNTESMSVVDADGAERDVAVELVRAYPSAIAGTLVDWRFDRATRTGELTLEAAGTTIVTAPLRLYPDGLEATVLEGEACVRWDAAREELRVGGQGRVRVGFGPAGAP